ncbi:S8/S53 family peptidase [Arcicella lustrica]|uniref:S8/S53 family peptidase n=1 Tax=Arcicella lustrica TaxID=2984196 RepID=A0ABU5SDY0_9BACT|nr:S8/S53 family peptidase [Arcicella sp. DC25W]MEA5425488.1 S8/S53 family peptidase [Arcicella sp. DC25W]
MEKSNTCHFVSPYKILIFLLFFVSLLSFQTAFTQALPAKYLLVFKDKNNSPYSITQPLAYLSERSVARRQKQKIAFTTRDLPVNPSYIEEVKKKGAKVIYTSRWMNAALIECSSTVLTSILQLSFVKGLEVNTSIDNPNNRTARKSSKFESYETNALNYGLSKTQIEMIGADKMHEQGFHGEGMMIAVLDAGFNNANNIAALKPLFDENRIVGTYDFVKKEKAVYEDDGHGTSVLSCMGAYLDGQIVGTAYKSSFLLLRTEDAFSEYLIEEANWLFGAEYADSVGVDLINSSLGYSTFDDASTSHKYSDLNGKTTIAAKAATWAASVGIVCVISAGNEGNDAWRYISTPADADSIITVGAVNALKSYAIFSSIGPSADGRVKPDLVALGQSSAIATPSGTVTTSTGTSFSSPILCGMVAGFWQANPTLTAMEVIDRLRKSGSQYENPDERLGYGIPDFTRANTPTVVLSTQNESNALFKAYPNPTSGEITIQLNETKVNQYFTSLMDITGKTLLYQPINSQIFKLSLVHLNRGTYFLRIGNESKSTLVKVLKVE